MKKIIEGSAEIFAPSDEKISKKLSVFYNPAMGLNRDVSVLLLNSMDKHDMQIADPMAATGIRSIRFLKELGKNKIKSLSINDFSSNAAALIKKNLELNKIHFSKNKKISLSAQDANLFLLNSAGFDYIDIDPFGSPNNFLDSSCKRIARGGILAVTATDTSALCGTFPNACIRKYWALPKKNSMMHETGLRILIRKVQLVSAQYEKALMPLYSYSIGHYMRVFFRAEKGRQKADGILKLHGMLNEAGPLWRGDLWDEKLAGRIYKNATKNILFSKNQELVKFLELIRKESRIHSAGFYDLHDVCRKNKIKMLLKRKEIIKSIISVGHRASATHFSGTGIRTNIPYDSLIGILEN